MFCACLFVYMPNAFNACRKDPMYALMVFSERMSEDNSWSASSSTRQCCDMPPPNQIGSTQSLADEKTHSAHTRKSLDISTSTPVTSRKTDLSPTHSIATTMSGTKFTRRAASPANTINDPPVPRGDLSLVSCGIVAFASLDHFLNSCFFQIKKRVLHAVSSKLVIPSLDAIASRSSNRSVTSNGSTSGTGYASAEPRSTGSPSIYLSPAATSRSGISIGVPSINLNSSRSGRLNLSDCFPEGYRTNMLWDFTKVDDGIKPHIKHEIAALPLESQQRVVLIDLLYCLSGVRGSYLTPLPPDDCLTGISSYETRFSMHMQLDKSLAEMVQEILPLASHFMGIQKVIAATDGRGQVNNSLNAALDELTHDYYVSTT